MPAGVIFTFGEGSFCICADLEIVADSSAVDVSLFSKTPSAAMN